MSECLVVDGLSKLFGTVEAVADVSFAVADGETLVLLGPSGCGKTTVLRCIAGLEQGTSGTIRIAGRVVADARTGLQPEARRVGMVFQSYALWPHMSVIENVMFACRHQGEMDRTPARERALELLAQFGLSRVQDRFPAQLSGGQQQRVALARAIAGNPKVLLMDEPLSALDPQLRDELRVGLRQSVSEIGLACVYVTHDQREALAMADEMVILEAGSVAEAGAPQTLYRKPSTLFGARFLGATNCIPKARVVQADEVAQRFCAEAGNVRLPFTPQGNWRPEVGDHATLAWRPEVTEVVQPLGEGNSCWGGTIEAAVFIGSGYEIRLRSADGGEVLARTAREISIGATCFIKMPSEEVLGFESQK